LIFYGTRFAPRFRTVPQSIIIRKNDWFCIWNCVWLYFKSVFNLKKTSNWIFLLFFDDFDTLILKIIIYIYIYIKCIVKPEVLFKKTSWSIIVFTIII
jgi:hypothetical protein